MADFPSSDRNCPESDAAARARRRRLLALKLKKKAPATATRVSPEKAGVQPVDRSGPLRPSLAQEQFWLLDQLGPNRAACNIGFLYRLRGRLDRSALELALSEIVRRHESLRSSIELASGGSRLILRNPENVRVRHTDLSGWPEDEAVAQALKLGNEHAGQPFSFETEPLLRARVYRLGEDDHVLLINTHHMASDAWSVSVLWRELTALYASFASAKPSPLPALEINYADYARWQRDRIEVSATAGRMYDYWANELAEVPGLSLPLDHARPTGAAAEGREFRYAFPAELKNGIVRLAERQGATVFSILLAGFQALLSRLTGQKDFAVGTALAGRHRTEFESLVGCFINMIALRANLDGEPTFGDLLGRVRGKLMEALEYDYMPFDRLLAQSGGRRDPSVHPIYQAVLIMHNTPAVVPALSGLEIEELPPPARHSPLDLSLTVEEAGEGFSIIVNYRVDILDEVTIRRWLRHFQTLLFAAVNDPGLPVSRLPLMDASELKVVLEDWNRTERDLRGPRTLHEAFLQCVRRDPDAEAIVSADGTMSYKQLEAQSRKLALELVACGVEPGDLVAVYIDPSPEMIVGLFGILRSGAAYVPLDTRSPSARVGLVLDSSKPRAVVTSRQAGSELPQGSPAVVYIEDVLKNDASGSTDALPSVEPTDLAYVIHTSGSTGLPKGVQVEHRSAINFVFGFIQNQGLGRGDRVLQLATISFDASIEEIFGTLGSGAVLVFLGDEIMESAEGFLSACRDARITALGLTAAHWHVLVREMAPRGLTLPETLRYVIIGGEPAARDCVQLWRQKIGAGVQLVNSYGPTETTVTATAVDLSSLSDDEVCESIPIGRPVANTTAYILDAAGEPVPVGVVGELCIGGPQVARGYLGMPEETDKRFIADRFSGVPGARLYKTGDLARYRPDGMIEFLGRNDHQVKVRGFRIELGEIECALERLDGVAQAVVLARKDDTGTHELEAYYVPETSAGVSREDIRHGLREVLPEYMIPARYIPMESMPMTTSGKIDRQALSALDESEQEPAERGSEAMTAMEEIVAAAWEVVFPGRTFAREDNFFDVGGDSLKAMRVVGALKDVVGDAVSLRLLFSHPTIEALAARIEEAGGIAESE